MPPTTDEIRAALDDLCAAAREHSIATGRQMRLEGGRDPGEPDEVNADAAVRTELRVTIAAAIAGEVAGRTLLRMVRQEAGHLRELARQAGQRAEAATRRAAA